MALAREYAHQQRDGYLRVTDKYGHTKEIAIDFPDPAGYSHDVEVWIHRAVHIWRASGTLFPPTPDELRWRDAQWDKECADWRQTLEFYEQLDKRPDFIRVNDAPDWEAVVEATQE
jgi:hypothetical protein